VNQREAFFLKRVIIILGFGGEKPLFLIFYGEALASSEKGVFLNPPTS